MLHTYTVLKKNLDVFNHLSWNAAKSITEEGDLLFTIKDNHISNVRVFEGVEQYGEKKKWFKSILNTITPHYQ